MRNTKKNPANEYIPKEKKLRISHTVHPERKSFNETFIHIQRELNKLKFNR
jgi:hypothetical protein